MSLKTTTQTTSNKNTSSLFSREKLSGMYAHMVNQPVCMQPGYLHTLLPVLRHGSDPDTSHDISDFMFLFGGGDEFNRVTVSDGIARIAVSGPIFNDDPSDFEVQYGYVASYKAIREDFQSNIADNDVKAIVFDIKSPGGIGGPLFDLMEEIRSASETKPTIAYIEDYGYSAAHGIASACTEIWISRGASCGSVGSIIVHEDISEALKKDGISIETFTYGKKKDQGASFKPLSDDARKEYNDLVSAHGEEFTQMVADNLGTEFKSIKKLEAGTFSGKEAIAAGLAHRIVKTQDVISEVSAHFSLASKKNNKGVSSKMDLKELKAEHPEAYSELMDAAKADVSDTGSGDMVGLTESIEKLKTMIDEQGKVIESQAAKIKESERLEAIRKAREIKTMADDVLTSALEDKDCNIPENLHSRVGVDHVKFLTDDGALDIEAYKSAVAEEIKAWEADLAKEDKNTVIGVGAGGNDADAEAKDIETINMMRVQAGLKPISA